MKFVLLVTITLLTLVPFVYTQARYDLYWGNSESALSPQVVNATWETDNYIVWHFIDPNTVHSVVATTTIQGVYDPSQLVSGYDPSNPNNYPFRSGPTTGSSDPDAVLFYTLFPAYSNSTPPGTYYFRDEYNSALTGFIQVSSESAAASASVAASASPAAASASAAAVSATSSRAAASPSSAAASVAASASPASASAAATSATSSRAAASPSSAAASVAASASPASPSSAAASASASISRAAASVAASVAASASRAAISPSATTGGGNGGGNNGQQTSSLSRSATATPTATTATPTASASPCIKDTDGDGVPDCFDLCPRNPKKTAPSGPYGCRNTPKSSHTVIEFDFDLLAPMNCTDIFGDSSE